MTWKRGLMRLCVLVSATGLGAISCQPAIPPTKETVLREMYLFSRAQGPDTTTFDNFVAAATSDTVWSTTQASWRAMRASYSATLGQLGYGTGPFTWEFGRREREALLRFQHDLGIAPTGQLDSLTVVHLARAGKALRMADVVLPDLRVNRIGSYFFAKGTWKAITSKLGYPVNTVDIVCDALREECSIVTVEFTSDELDRIAVNRYNLPVTYRTNDILIASEGDGVDARILTINVPAKEALWTQVNPDSTFRGDTLGPSKMTLRLVDGMNLSPPFDGGELKDVHEALFKDRDRYLGLLKKNMLLQGAKQ